MYERRRLGRFFFGLRERESGWLWVEGEGEWVVMGCC